MCPGPGHGSFTDSRRRRGRVGRDVGGGEGGCQTQMGKSWGSTEILRTKEESLSVSTEGRLAPDPGVVPLDAVVVALPPSHSRGVPLQPPSLPVGWCVV